MAIVTQDAIQAITHSGAESYVASYKQHANPVVHALVSSILTEMASFSHGKEQLANNTPDVTIPGLSKGFSRS